jgi:flagellar biosynthesis/type III secretory pathway protein FliH
MLATSIKQREKELVQQGIEQGVQQGIQQGIQKGIKQGVQQGELKKTKSIIYKTLLKKFNIEMNAVSDIIESLNDIHKLDEILNVLIEQNNIDEVKKILDIK